MLSDFLVRLIKKVPKSSLSDRRFYCIPDNARIGTVDKFQGQEAPVCLLSMTTSSANELPRDIEFLFSLNRINVAISRAQILSLVFASPRLLEVPCNTVGDMRLVNTVCALAS